MRKGDLAVDFELPDENGTPRRLSDLVTSGPVVLFFYPGAMTYGCTRESCHFRDLRGEFEAVGAQPIGISADPVEKQKKFSDMHSFGYPLLSDPDGSVAEHYDVRRRIAALGNRRKTFVINTDLRVLGVVQSEVSFASHADKALEVLRAVPRPEGTSTGDLPITDRTGLRRQRERGTHDRAVVHAILDEGLLCHVGVNDGTPVVTPMAYARVGDRLYLHGAPGNRTLRLVADGVEACVTVTLLDALVLARSAFHHSMNYRCVMLFGAGSAVKDPEEKFAASTALLEHMASGRSADARMPTESELRSTLIVRFPIDEGSAKVRTGGPKDDEEDLAKPIWAGQIPFDLVARPAVPDHGLPEGTVVPPYAARYPRRGRT